MISRFCIERPVFANVIAMIMLLLGGVALLNLPVAQYPPITPPTVQVTTRYPGASARTVVDTVALPIEQQVQAQGVTTAKRSASILEIITLTSPDGRYDSLFLSNYATINLKDAISRLPGIGSVTIFGAAQYAMRIWLDPDALQARGFVPSDVIQAVQQQNEQVTAGQVGMPPALAGQAFQYTVNMRGRIAQAAEFEDIIVKADAGQGGRITRVRDIARVEHGAQSYNQIFRVDGQPSAGLAISQLPEANALDVATEVAATMERMSKSFPQGVTYAIPIAGISALDNNATLANAGVAYVILKDWSERGPKEGLLALYTGLQAALEGLPDGDGIVLPPPAIQGIGNASGFTMQVELRDNSFDLAKLENATQAMVKAADTQSGLRHLSSSFRAEVPQLFVDIDQVAAETLQVPVGAVFDVIEIYLGSTYIGQLNRFGRTSQVYAQADVTDRADPEAIRRRRVRNAGGDMVPVGAFAEVHSVTGPSLISLYNLYPTATIQGTAAPGFSSGQALALMEQIAARTLPPGMGYEWTAMSFQEKQVGAQAYYVFALALTLVWLVLAAQYESWTAPGAVTLAVPLALLGTVATLSALGVANNLYVQIGLVLLIALGSKNAILIVEYARELAGKSIHEAAVEAARRRFRPILMTSFAFILGVLPLVLASGAGANSRKSIGITVFSGMLASTCLALLFVPSLFVVLRRFDEWRLARKTARKG
ncbi:MAG: efflux RND transporter permease subunit [Nitrococcus sp.]|nr:efflux RND transporter permease subunit [Nitrococcus sp.]